MWQKASKQYRDANTEILLKKAKIYRDKPENKMRSKLYSKQYRFLNHGELLVKKKNYYEENKYWINPKKREQETGWSLENFNKALEIQEHKCLACGILDKDTPEGYLVCDHDHNTGAIRCLLCAKCNSIEGFAGGNINTLRKLANIVEFYNKNQDGKNYVPYVEKEGDKS